MSDYYFIDFNWILLCVLFGNCIDNCNLRCKFYSFVVKIVFKKRRKFGIGI